MLVLLVTWACFALRDRPVAYYVSLFLTCGLLTAVGEPTATLLLHLYNWRLKIVAAFLPDRALASLVISFFLDPLLGVLFCRYAEPWPVPKAAAAAVLLGGFEIWLRNHGYMHYTGWHSFYSVLVFFSFFLIAWRISLRPWPVPHWLNVFGLTVWLLYFFDTILQGVLGLWHFNVPHWYQERLFSMLLHAVLFAPAATAIAVLPLRRRWLWSAAALASLIVVAFALKAAGLLQFGWIGLAAALADYGTMISLAVAYSRWLRRREPAEAPPPWEPPIQLR